MKTILTVEGTFGQQGTRERSYRLLCYSPTEWAWHCWQAFVVNVGPFNSKADAVAWGEQAGRVEERWL